MSIDSTKITLSLKLGAERLIELLNQLTPVRIHMTPTDEDRRWLELDSPTSASLVAGKGLRVSTRGRLRYKVLGITVPVTIRTLELMLSPRIGDAGDASRCLMFDVEILDADLSMVPAVVDSMLVSKLNAALSPHKTKAFWEFGETLSRAFNLPRRLEPLDQFTLTSTGGAVVVTDEFVQLRLDFGAQISRMHPLAGDG